MAVPIPRKSKSRKSKSRTNWFGFEKERDEFHQLAHNCYESGKILDQCCEKNDVSALAYSVWGLKNHNLINQDCYKYSPTCIEAIENGNDIMKLVAMNGQLLVKGFDSIFLQHEYQAIMLTGLKKFVDTPKAPS